MLPFPVDTSFAASGDRNFIDFESIFVRTPYGELLYAGSLNIPEMSVEGIVKSSSISYSGISLEGSFFLKANRKHLFLESENITIRDVSFKHLTAEAFLEEKYINFSLAGSLSVTERNSFSADGTFQFDPKFLELNLQLDDMPVSEAYRYVAQKEDSASLFLEPFSLSAAVLFSTDFSKYSFAASSLNLSDGINRSITASASGNDTGITLRGFNLVYNGYRLGRDINLSFPKKDRLDFNSSFAVFGRSYNLSGSYIEGRSLNFRGNNGIDGLAIWYGKKISFRFQTVELPVPIFGDDTLLTVYARGNYSSNLDWEIVLKNAILTSMPIPLENNRLELSLRLTPDICSLYSLEYSDIVSSLSGSGIFDISKAESRDVSGWIKLSNTERKEEYNLIGSVNPHNISAKSASGMLPLKGYTYPGYRKYNRRCSNYRNPLI